MSMILFVFVMFLYETLLAFVCSLTCQLSIFQIKKGQFSIGNGNSIDLFYCHCSEFIKLIFSDGNFGQAKGRLVSSGSIMHSYPFCWRSETPLLYRAVPSWYEFTILHHHLQNLKEKIFVH
jgi:hypothetical protein